ncbi:MAG: XapX domain-containing protein [Acidobacteria bacterium]|nr:MAG: XapX domain-containing protein [Acidobacteriota bacterium]
MKVLFLSFAVGLGVGVLYGLIRVKSPAPPIVALLGLLGMVLGEQLGVAILPEFHCSCVRAGCGTGECAEAGRNRDQRRADSHAGSGAKPGRYRSRPADHLPVPLG